MNLTTEQQLRKKYLEQSIDMDKVYEAMRILDMDIIEEEYVKIKSYIKETD